MLSRHAGLSVTAGLSCSVIVCKQLLYGLRQILSVLNKKKYLHTCAGRDIVESKCRLTPKNCKKSFYGVFW